MHLPGLRSRRVGIRACGSVGFVLLTGCLSLLLSNHALAQASRSGNPILPGWYADPEARIFQNEYWIYPTYSAPYDKQVFMDAFSSKDLVIWKKRPRVLDGRDIRWAKRAFWAPSVVRKGGWYYLFFGANDIQNDQELGGIGVARSRRPEGPFSDYLGRPLIDKFHNGAQPIDQFVFEDRDGSHYIIYGGWQHCNIAKLKDDFTGFIPFADGTTFKEITPKGYVEGAFMFIKDAKYYFMWSEGGWTGPDYAVAYAIASSPFGPFNRVGKILQQDASVATGAGHHSVLHAPGSNKWYIVYHRRPLGETDRNHRVVCIDEMRFDEQGLIRPVVITKDGVPRDVLRRTSAFEQTLESAQVASVFRSVLPRVKRLAKVSVLLPSKLPSTVKEEEIKVVDGEDTENGYEISLYYEEGCGNACFAGFFSAKRGEKPEPELSDKVVRLSNGIRGYYTAKSCGVSCTPPQIEWLQDGVLYTVQFKVNGKNKEQDEAEIIRLANSAIKGGAR